MYQLDGPTFFHMAHRMGAYQGVIRMRHNADAARLHANDEPPVTATATAVGEPARQVDLTSDIAASADLAGLFEAPHA